jgi:hypothetical protein
VQTVQYDRHEAVCSCGRVHVAGAPGIPVGQGQSPPLVRGVRHVLAGLMALPPTGNAAQAGGSGRGRLAGRRWS